MRVISYFFSVTTGGVPRGNTWCLAEHRRTGGGVFGAADKRLQAFVGNCPTLSWVYYLFVNEYTEAGRPDNFPICPTKQ